MSDKRKLSGGQIFFLVIVIIMGILAFMFGIMCIVFHHLLEGIAIVIFDIVLVSLLIMMISNSGAKKKMPYLGDKLFSMRGITVFTNGEEFTPATVNLMTEGIFIEGGDKSICGNTYLFEDISVFSSNSLTEFSFGIPENGFVSLTNVKKLHAKALIDSFTNHMIQRVDGSEYIQKQGPYVG